MYTNCPECGTVFRISTNELRVAEGNVRCGHCSATFNALTTLADELPSTVAPGQLIPPPELKTTAAPVPLPVSEDTLEFDIPEDSWSNFFEADGPEKDASSMVSPEPEAGSDAEEANDQPVQPEANVGSGIGPEAVAQADDWQALLSEVQDDEASPAPVYVISEEPPAEPVLPEAPWPDPPPGSNPMPAPLPADFAADLPGAVDVAPGPELGALAADRPFLWQPPVPPAAVRSGRHWAYAAGSALLALLLLIQVLHRQRDELATHPALAAAVQRTYAALGLPLWPAWDLRAYELRNSEAVTDRSSPGALDILARIAVVGNNPVGLPLVRVTLRDRLSRPLGSRVFRPEEYLGKNSRPRELVSPGTLIPMTISLQDPGPDAQGFDVDVCVMSRREGIICRVDREPFVR